MKIEFDEEKRQKTLQERGLDFGDAKKVFATTHFELTDDRKDYGEIRYITFGELNDRAVAIVWTARGDARRIISMRHAHDEEIKARQKALD